MTTLPRRPLARFSRKAVLICGVCAVSLILLQPVAAQEDPADAAAPMNTQGMPATTAVAVPTQGGAYIPGSLSDSDRQALSSAIQYVRTRNYAQADSLGRTITDPATRKLVTWYIINNDGHGIYSFAALDAARRDLWGWPRESKRQIAAEKMITQSGMTPQQTVEWFSGSPPQTIEGASALITAYGLLGRVDEAQTLTKTWWTTKVFDAGAQANFYQAFGKYLDQADHKARIACLALNTQSGSSQAIRDLYPYVDQHQRDIGQAVIAMRTGAAGSDGLYQTALAGDPGNQVLAFARAKYLAGRDLEALGYGILPNLPPASMSPEASKQIFDLRLTYFKTAIKERNYRAAYDAMNGGGFSPGESMAEAEFFAGWMALVKLNDKEEALRHFHALATSGTSPITMGRANYWLGRAYEARNDTSKNDAATAKAYYTKGGQYIYAFYGQLAAEKAGQKEIVLGKDPVPSEADRARFNGRDQIQAARILGSLGETDLFRVLVLHVGTTLPNAEEQALLVDLSSMYDTPINTMKVARQSMQRGFYLPERAYPVRSIPGNPSSAEKAFVLAIARQESGFDPSVRSHANARGMMQLIPSTARAVSRRLSISYTDSKLYEPEYNMTLGSYHLGELVDMFNGSYVLAAAGYNAGPSRMGTWIGNCGDPRGQDADALSFIECHPFSETRNYMMRVTENVRVYRARLNGGRAPLTAHADITRGMPAPIGRIDSEEFGGDMPAGPIAYGEYQNGQAAGAAAIVAGAGVAAMKPIADPKPAAARPTKKKAAATKASTKKTTKKKKRN
ncbi:transglycosylase SLT domain protein [Asticcacaulis biprosthecium C19]|uniref:Transglycosylase SLT domain protein n=1 Tax=Asticcacaulis biprosthecium C19 TaxID=715226 RepID=F4QR11_9CAUL|nr:lytic transglycosylase domain-containing protein [Asticcacaulis biprosthecium]EGF90648.1 transglycosylase SLT domain protein [Asticcacaulis biprosthecium C19]